VSNQMTYDEFMAAYPVGTKVKVLRKTYGDPDFNRDIGKVLAISAYKLKGVEHLYTTRDFNYKASCVEVGENYYSHTDLEPLVPVIPVKQIEESTMDINTIIAQHIEAEVQKRISELEKESISETVARLQKLDPDALHDACERLDVCPPTVDLMKVFFEADDKEFVKKAIEISGKWLVLGEFSNKDIGEYIDSIREPSEFLSEFTSGQLIDALKEKEVNLTHAVLNMIENMNMEECVPVFKELWKDFKDKLVVEL